MPRVVPRRQKTGKGEAMRVIFNLIGTVLGSTDKSLRPGIRETIEDLRADGCKVDFWVNGPSREFEALLAGLGIEGRVYSKFEVLPFRPDVCVDSAPEGCIPYRVLKVSDHVSAEMPGGEIKASRVVLQAVRPDYPAGFMALGASDICDHILREGDHGKEG